MAVPNILTDTTPALDDRDGSLVHSVITDAWGLHFAQGGVVMAAGLRAMAAVLGREDLGLASASATFCRPVACGPVTTHVDVLRSGRRGAQVLGSLRDATAPEGEVSVAMTAVFTDPAIPGPQLAPVPRPPELSDAPTTDGESIGNAFPLGFLDNTAWHVATGSAEPASSAPIPRLALWFRFNDPPAPAGVAWHPALLPIPGDALGSALVVALGGGDSPVGSVSLQIDIQFLAPTTGTWIGIDSTCTHVGNGLATGVVHLWSEAGAHVATATQTAMLRGLGASGTRSTSDDRP
ncbi:thioesterase family protein [Dermatobacter hominis]|uniref:thioesterase family protein n=1 Tax=Dermatobacter hominis TaxID=2884263 RepID=UPI001D10B104|nr:thioesterase family protein [Dermatobacter hominis]UDY35023.1 thioesterase family protein [Dermatobacter hominis]